MVRVRHACGYIGNLHVIATPCIAVDGVVDDRVVTA